jgi:hypothetical protein
VITRDEAIATARRHVRSERLKANRRDKEKEERSGRTATGRTSLPLLSGVRILAVRTVKLERAALRPERWEGVCDIWHIHLEGDPPPARWKGGYRLMQTWWVEVEAASGTVLGVSPTR